MRIPILLIIIISTLGFSGCETASDNTAPDHAAVSSIPWNKPASWEGTGSLGGFMQQGGH